MIYLPKSQPAPQSLSIEKSKASGTYLTHEVLTRLKKDFRNKCYICEFKKPPTINVEHFHPHQGDIDKKFDWDNLFYSCAHCNNIKLAKYDNILNCTKKEHNVDTQIHYRIYPFPAMEAEITSSNDDSIVQDTVEFLLKVYNGHTDLKTIEAENIRSKLIEEIVSFQELLFKYISLDVIDANDETRKNDLKNSIIDQLKPSSDFTAFKRCIIRDYRDGTPLKDDFISYCE
ncbi:hypothetical protein COJ23_25095 [Priestia megaterium]|uniref:HNH endonuclease n=1 Tax=Priestia megaterium TaxID=1404 RepID=UPI000BF73928|nr:hypothetical protein [Priestia megaterium]PFK43440.1 hypothetical protein COJ23_25095 [Priestia megaterium]